jgi:hypothetical protein
VIGPEIVAAPAPLPRPPKAAPPDAVTRLEPRDRWGDWVFTWGNGQWELLLSPFGTYRCRLAGACSEWVGSWHLDGDGRLCIEERCVTAQGAGAPWQWYVVWAKDKEGRMSRSKPAGDARWATDGRQAATVALSRKR